jgi:hypothetical protein
MMWIIQNTLLPTLSKKAVREHYLIPHFPRNSYSSLIFKVGNLAILPIKGGEFDACGYYVRSSVIYFHMNINSYLG